MEGDEMSELIVVGWFVCGLLGLYILWSIDSTTKPNHLSFAIIGPFLLLFALVWAVAIAIKTKEG